MKSYIMLASIALQLAFQPAARAEHPHHGDILKKLDANGDGQLSKDEVKDHKFLADKFDEIDTNKDGQLSTDELKAFHDAHPHHSHDKGGKDASAPAPAE